MDLCWAQRCPPGCLQFLFPRSVVALPEQLHVQPWGVLSEFFLSSHFSSFRETLQTLDGPKLGTSPKIFALGFLHFRKLFKYLGEQRYSKPSSCSSRIQKCSPKQDAPRLLERSLSQQLPCCL